ncbi:TPA: hypothetical protein N0F65_012174 [Lagenidium giganteum]|uniref:B box-type domain-containing protein n=1 Tax=Lagenidium giganteum TaxID=4803 RepID=A0AAV2ZEE9_9STRA|nr:TPA: hypothetical protein N0F65_012174 [Lagenidium giganteum]
MATPGSKRSRSTAEPANEYVALAQDLQGCMAFQPKKWRQVLEKSQTTLRQRQRQDTVQARVRPRPSSREELVLPSVQSYLHQPELVQQLLVECEDDDAQEYGRSRGSESAEEDCVNDSFEDWHPQNQQQSFQSDDPPNVTMESILEVLPVLRLVSSKVTQELARLPPPSRYEMLEIAALEKHADHATRRQQRHLYKQLHKQQRQLRWQRERRPSFFNVSTRPLVSPPKTILKTQSTPTLTISASSLSSPKQRSSMSSMTSSSSPTREAERRKIEQVQMTLEDVNALLLPVPEPPLPSTRLSALLDATREALPVSQHSFASALLQERKMAQMDADAAEERVRQTLASIKRWMPLEVIYAHGLGTCASPAQQRATHLLVEAAHRLRSNMLVQAMMQWKRVVADVIAGERRHATVTLQCWWRQRLSVWEVRQRRAIRAEPQRRQRAMLQLLAQKEEQAARVITAAMRTYTTAKRRRRLQREEQAATFLQRAWRKVSQRWNALRIYLRKQRRLEAAICIQRHVRGHRARKRCCVLRKIRHVNQQRAHAEVLRKQRLMTRYHLGAVLRIQRAFRAWQYNRVEAFRRRRRQFERDKKRALRVQAQFRMVQAMRHYRQVRQKVHAATLVLQCAWRSYRARCVVQVFKAERQAEKGRREKEHKRQRKLRDRFRWNPRGKNAAAVPPGTLRPVSSYTPADHRAATKLQARWRGMRLRRRVRYEQAAEREAARRAIFKKRRVAATRIQKRVRGMQGRALAWRMQVHRSAGLIQRVWRGCRTRKELIRMHQAMKALQKLQRRWREQRSKEKQRLRTRAARKIQFAMRRYLCRRALFGMVRRRQLLSEENAKGKVLVERTRKRVKDELLVQSFLHKSVIIENDNDKEEKQNVARSLYDVKKPKLTVQLAEPVYQWKRKGVDGVWQELFRFASGSSTSGEIDNSHFARFVKGLPHAFINKTTLPMQKIDLVFAKMKEPKTRTIKFARFNKAMLLVWMEKYSVTAPETESTGDGDAIAQAQPWNGLGEDKVLELYLRFMHHFVLVAGMQGGRFAKLLDELCTQRVAWALRILRRLSERLAQRKHHDHFLIAHRAFLAQRHETECARKILHCYRRYQFRCRMKGLLAAMFVEYLDYRGHAVRFKHKETGRVISKRPAFLKGVVCAVRIPLPFPGEEFHAYCERHESRGSRDESHSTPARVPAEVYCVECEDAMCLTCHERDHNKRQALKAHEIQRIHVCVHCKTETATRECLQCGNGRVPYCDVCFPHVHNAPPLDAHRQRVLVVTCIDCNQRVAQWRCKTCQGDLYCKRCLSAFHSKGQRQDHIVERLSYYAVLKQQAELKRSADAEKERERRRLDEEAAIRQRAAELQLRHDSATRIQARVRALYDRRQGRAYMKLVRQTQAARQQRIRDEKVRSSVVYRLRNVVGMAPPLKSDTAAEIAARGDRVQAIKNTLFFYKRLGKRKQDDTKKWTKKERESLAKALRTWLQYDLHVKIHKGTWKHAVAKVVSVKNVRLNGFVLVYIPLAHRAVVIRWEHMAPYTDEDKQREEYVPATHALFNRAHDFHIKLSLLMERAARRARLLYLQTLEFNDIAPYAWVIEYNKNLQQPEYWNVVTNRRTLEQPRALQVVERMEQAKREEVEDRTALAKAKLTRLLNPYQFRDKVKLPERRNAIAVASKTDSAFPEHSDAIACARFWQEKVVADPVFGGNKALKFAQACSSGSPEHTTMDMWVIVKVWRWMEHEDPNGFEPQAVQMFKLADDDQLFIAKELTPVVDKEEMAEARDRMVQLLKLEEDARHLLMLNAQQQKEQAEEKAKRAALDAELAKYRK